MIYRLNVIPVKFTVNYIFENIDKLILKFKWRARRPRITNTNLKKNEVERITLLDIRLTVKLQ